MNKKRKIKIQSHNNKPNYKWAFQTLIFSISLSCIFGLLSQTLLSSLGVAMAIVGISIFIFISVVFDMFGIAVASADEKAFLEWRKEGKFGASAGLHLCENSEKVCCLCADVVGDICSTLCGAGGACVVVALTQTLKNPNLVLFISTLVSAVIAGLTIFFKALMKEYAISNSNKLILFIGRFLEKRLLRKKKKSLKNEKKL